MSKEEVLTIDRAVWERIRQVHEKAQIKERYKYLLDLMKDGFDED